MLMCVFRAVFVHVGMLVCDMVVLVRGVRMCMGHIAVFVLVRMRRGMGVLLGHGCPLSCNGGPGVEQPRWVITCMYTQIIAN